MVKDKAFISKLSHFFNAVVAYMTHLKVFLGVCVLIIGPESRNQTSIANINSGLDRMVLHIIILNCSTKYQTPI